MDSKKELIEKVRQWIRTDNEIKQLQREIKERRVKKKELTEILVSVMKQNDIECFDINDGKLIYTQNTVKSPLSKKHLLNTLNDMFKNDPEQAAEIGKHILESREEKTRESIKRKMQK